MALSCLALWLAPGMHARGQDAGFDAANRASAEGKWTEAVRGYENVIIRHGYSAPVLFNLANAQVAEGKLGPAILNYERARWLAPNDPDIAANLALARRKAGLEPETTSHLAAVAHSMTWTEWSILATAMLWLVAAALPLRRMLPRARPALTAAAVLGALVLLAAVSALALRWPDLNRAIVTAPEAAARVSPVTVIQPLFTLRAGEPVTIKRTHGAFMLIANRQGREGWVSREAVTPVVNVRRAG
jgi:tetratricopeptide (TPR) repeat protein